MNYAEEMQFLKDCKIHQLMAELGIDLAHKEVVEVMLDAGYQKPMTHKEVTDYAESPSTWK